MVFRDKTSKIFTRNSSGLWYFGAAIFLMTFCTKIYAADLSNLIERIEHNLPEKWEIVEIKNNCVPRWAFSKDTCTKLTIIGPVKSGFQYFDRNDQLLLYHISFQEAVYLWIADEQYDSGWTLPKKVKNRFQVCPRWRPQKLMSGKHQVWGYQGWNQFDKTYSEKSPPGTAKARFKKTKHSWPGWKRQFKSLIRYNRDGRTGIGDSGSPTTSCFGKFTATRKMSAAF